MPADGTPRVSLIIPVYNPGPYLRPCLDSVFGQDIAPEELEIVAVDDGSDDGSAEVLDAYAAEHGNLRVIHQENSGWPGHPRNVGLAEARGRYAFFLDSDDCLGAEALRRLADFADEHASDIVVPRIAGLGGRRVVESVYDAGNQVDADRAPLFGALGPMKLFRREFLEAQDLRFPEGRLRLEDGRMVARAYLTAGRVSLLTDYEHYYLRRREDGSNISAQLGQPDEYLGAVAAVIDIARQSSTDSALLDKVAVDLYERKALRHLGPERFLEHSSGRGKAWVAAVGELARTHVPVAAEKALPLDARLRSRLAREGDVKSLRALLALQRDGEEPVFRVRGNRVELRLPGRAPHDVTEDIELQAAATRVRSRRGRVDMSGQVRLERPPQAHLPITLTLASGDWRASADTVADAVGGSQWCSFDERFATEGAPDAPLEASVAFGTLKAPLGAVAPQAPPWPPLRMRRAAGAVVRSNPITRAGYRALGRRS